MLWGPRCKAGDYRRHMQMEGLINPAVISKPRVCWYDGCKCFDAVHQIERCRVCMLCGWRQERDAADEMPTLFGYTSGWIIEASHLSHMAFLTAYQLEPVPRYHCCTDASGASLKSCFVTSWTKQLLDHSRGLNVYESQAT
jgi:hypothetical protein